MLSFSSYLWIDCFLSVAFLIEMKKRVSHAGFSTRNILLKITLELYEKIYPKLNSKFTNRKKRNLFRMGKNGKYTLKLERPAISKQALEQK